MAKMNFERPYFKYIDNLKRVRSELESWHNTPCAPNRNNETMRHVNKKEMITFNVGDYETCMNLLEATEAYYDNACLFFEGIKNKKKNKIDIKKYELNLRARIREFISEGMKAIVLKNENCGIFRFYKLLEKSLPKDDLLFEMIKQEIDEMNNSLDPKSA